MSTKDKVLEILRNESSVSGEKLALQCNVSRTAIWKAVNSLRAQGYDIYGTTNSGYSLQNNGDVLNEIEIRKHLSNQTFHIEVFQEIDSTNTYAKRLLASEGSLRDLEGNLTEAGKSLHRAIFVAESQSLGRGRLGRSFISPSKTGLYMSLVYAPKNGISEPAKLTAFAAVAVKNTIDKLFDVKSSIKWINDIFLNGKKICGILTEGFTNFETSKVESAVIGIGINISDSKDLFEKSGSTIAGSIVGTNKANVSRAYLAAEIALSVFETLERDPSIVMKEYQDASMLNNKTVEVHPIIGDQTSYYNAIVEGIDDNAFLVVRLPNGEIKHLSSGEVSLHGSLINSSKY